LTIRLFAGQAQVEDMGSFRRVNVQAAFPRGKQDKDSKEKSWRIDSSDTKL
jgi:hypothetical protein